MTHGSTAERATKIRDAAKKLAVECKRNGQSDSKICNAMYELCNLEDSSLATLYNILNGVK